MPEAVRLVIWDLDDTFWKGTVTEGGIKEYVQAHHDIVVELAKRGIISSICSKNDEATILDILREKKILDFFVFPSISWAPKGARLASLIEAVQLRPSTVMFIDDNPSNRAEAAAAVPGLQVEDETFISRLLDDPRFVGKDDSKLTRLAQYKLLERRKSDELQSSGNNEEFLHGCDIRVYIERDVPAHLDRAIELINRTNQLNFTKQRLPEDLALAREQLTKEISINCRQSGLVRVADKYGDYGFVGFFLIQNGVDGSGTADLKQTLLHYCFSCRTLGMMVEKWLYDRFQRPKINVVGEVLTDLFAPRTVDWIKLVPSLDGSAAPMPKLAPEIRIHGGCEATSIGHYLTAYTDKVVVTANFSARSYFHRVNGASLLLSACDRAGPEFEREAALLHMPYDLLINNYFKAPPEGTVFVFGGQYDCPGPNRVRHKVHGWEMRFEQDNLGNIDVIKMPEEELSQKLADLKVDDEKRKQISAVCWHLRENYESVPSPRDDELARSMHRLIGRIPVGSKLIVMLDHDVTRTQDGALRHMPWVKYYMERVIPIVVQYPFVGTASFADFIQGEDEIHVGGNHYDRKVYHRMAEGIVSIARKLPPNSGQLVTRELTAA